MWQPRAQRRRGRPAPRLRSGHVERRDIRPRSTKAGPAGPATPRSGHRRASGLPQRSTTAGPAGPATRQPDEERRPRRARSTKAGPAGPATRQPAPSSSGQSPGAQRRRGRPAPRLAPASLRCCRTPRALNEGGAGRPRDSGDPVHDAARHHRRSTKAGPAGPATPAPTRRSGAPHKNAQRRRGRPAPRLEHVAQRRSVLIFRSTKAGPAGPATQSAA